MDAVVHRRRWLCRIGRRWPDPVIYALALIKQVSNIDDVLRYFHHAPVAVHGGLAQGMISLLFAASALLH